MPRLALSPLHEMDVPFKLLDATTSLAILPCVLSREAVKPWGRPGVMTEVCIIILMSVLPRHGKALGHCQ